MMIMITTMKMMMMMMIVITDSRQMGNNCDYDENDNDNDDDDDDDNDDDIEVTAELERTRCVLQSRDEEVEALTREVLFDFVKTIINCNTENNKVGGSHKGGAFCKRSHCVTLCQGRWFDHLLQGRCFLFSICKHSHKGGGFGFVKTKTIREKN